jgi:hypothetical protein
LVLKLVWLLLAGGHYAEVAVNTGLTVIDYFLNLVQGINRLNFDVLAFDIFQR